MRHVGSLRTLSVRFAISSSLIPVFAFSPLVPNLGAIKRRAAAELEAFQNAVGLVPELNASPTKKKKKAEKRPATDGASTSSSASVTPAKRPASGHSPLNKEDLCQHVLEGTLEKLTVPLLKQGLSTLGIKAASYRKADLVDAISRHFSD